MECFWMVMSDVIDRAAPRVRHSRYDIAVNEARRLAKLSPGERFYVLATVGSARTADPVTYEVIDCDQIPF